MPVIPYINKKIGSSHLVWFQNSNLYLQLKEPAWFVFSRLQKRYKATTISGLFAARYHISVPESLKFIREIEAEMDKLNKPGFAPTNTGQYPEALHHHPYDPFAIHYYRMGTQVIAFSYESSLFESYIHPLIAHFETSTAPVTPPLFELFQHEGRIVFRFNGQVRGVWTREETQYVKGLIFMFLLNAMHDKTDDDWLMTVHASAITNGKKTMLFSAEAGKGKTTFAALMQANGYKLISDDFVPIDRHKFCAYPFPISVSVKPGSMELLTPLFPILEEKTITHLSAEKSVRYISPPDYAEVFNSAFPVREVIFIEYNREVDFSLEKLDPVVALKSLLEQVWVTPLHGNSALFLDRVRELSFYKLTYSNNQRALDAISNLFDRE